MPRATAGILVECDPSILSIIKKIDDENGHDFIIEVIDDEHVLVKGGKHEMLKGLLKDYLQDAVREPEESSGED